MRRAVPDREGKGANTMSGNWEGMLGRGEVREADEGGMACMG